MRDLTAYLAQVDAATELDRRIDEERRSRDILARQVADLVDTDELDLARVTTAAYVASRDQVSLLGAQRADVQRRMNEALADVVA